MQVRPVSYDDLVLHVLHGLPPEYDLIIAAIQARDSSISLAELHKKLLDFEAHLNRNKLPSMVPIIEHYACCHL